MHRVSRRLTAAVVAACAAAVSVVGVGVHGAGAATTGGTAPSAPHAAPAKPRPPAWYRSTVPQDCTMTEGPTPFYAGASASTTYDRTFRTGHSLPAAFLRNWTPQGVGAWANWNGKGDPVVLVSGYNDKAHHSALIGLVPGHTNTQTVLIPKAHVGGVAVVGNWLFVTGPKPTGGYPTINRFALSAVRHALLHGGSLKPAHTAVIGAGGKPFYTSFLSKYGSVLYVGMYDANHRNRMYRYAVSARGDLSRIGGASDWIQVPQATQGLAVTATHYVFSSSAHRAWPSVFYVVRRGAQYLDTQQTLHKMTCFGAPSMSEGLAIVGPSLYAGFESAAAEYRKPPPRNVVPGLHYAPLATLVAMN